MSCIHHCGDVVVVAVAGMAVALAVEQQASAAEAEFEWSLIGRSSYRAGGSETPVERASRDEGSLKNRDIGQSVEKNPKSAVIR